MLMTYSSMLQRLRFRTLDLREVKFLWNDDGALFNALNDAVQEIYKRTRDQQESASLSIVAGTRDYTVSSAIGTDVGEILYIKVDDGFIMPRTLKGLDEEVFKDTSDEDELTSETPRYFRVWDGVLRLHPSPAETETATVYYIPTKGILDYSAANAATAIPLRDDYLYPCMLLAAGILYEIAGNEQKAVARKAEAWDALAHAQAAKEDYGYDGIKYHDVLTQDSNVRIV